MLARRTVADIRDIAELRPSVASWASLAKCSRGPAHTMPGTAGRTGTGSRPSRHRAPTVPPSRPALDLLPQTIQADQRDSAPGARWLASGYLQPVENVRDGHHKEQAGVPGGPAAPLAHAVLVEGRPDDRVVLAGIGQHLRNRLRAAAVERVGPPARRVVSTAGGSAGVRPRRVQRPIASLRLASSSGDTSSTWVATAQWCPQGSSNQPMRSP